MATGLGVIALFGFIGGVILLAAGVTWIVVKISPATGSKQS
jgi:hypothetical protein